MYTLCCDEYAPMNEDRCCELKDKLANIIDGCGVRVKGIYADAILVEYKGCEYTVKVEKYM